MPRNTRPEIGTKMYSVHEHLYYIEKHAGPVLEYCVCEAEVTGFFQGGYTEVCLVGLSPEGYRTPYRYKLSDIGSKVFYTAKEAAQLAQKMTEQYERTWGWIGAPDIQLRRTWEKYLSGGEAMRTISAMYEYTGGTDYRHVCGDCRSCVEAKSGKKTVYRCTAFGSAAEWDPKYMACKAFKAGQKGKTMVQAESEPEEITGAQMRLEDFLRG